MANTLLRIGYTSGSGGGGGISQYPDLASFPPTGSVNVLYFAIDTAKLYAWNGATYVEASPSLVTSVNTQVGDVVLDKSDVGLSNVDNTSDADKPISDDTQDALDALDDRIIPIEDRAEVLTVYAYENNTQVYADGQPGIKDPSALIRDGWYFKNSIAGQKINWYYFDGTSQGNITLGDFKSAYAIMTFDAVSGAASPIIAIYTSPTGAGDVIPGFAHSRIVYDGPMTPTPVVGKQYLVYAGENPPVRQDLPRINLALITGSSIGDKLPTEQILTVSFGSNSAASVDSVQYMVETLGLFSDPVKHEMDLRIRVASQDALDLKVAKAGDTMTGNLVVHTGTTTATLGSNNLYITDSAYPNNIAYYGQDNSFITSQADDVNNLLDAYSNRLEVREENYVTYSQKTTAITPSEISLFTADDGIAAPAIATLPEHVTTKKYVDDQDALKEDVANKSIDGTLASNSDTLYPSEKAVKTYADAITTSVNAIIDSLAYSQIIYVDKNNTRTYTASGTIDKPFKSLEAMYTAITDAGASKRYACIIAPGTYVEAATIRLKGWIDLTSFATDTVIISVAGGVTLKWSNNNPGRVFIKDIGFTSGLEILNDDPTGTSGIVLDLDNVDAPSILFNGRGGGRDFIQLRNDTRITGCTIRSAATTIFDSTGIGTLVMNDVGCLVPDSFGSAITASIRSNYIGAISISATTYDIYTDAWGTVIAGNLTIASNASSYPCYFNYDATSYPLGTVTLTGTNPAQLVQTSVAQAIRYTPIISGNWAAPAPTEVKAALDSLAANKIAITEKAAINGVASLDETGKVPLSQLPASTFSADVLEFANLAAFPIPGVAGIVYVALDTNKIYRWSTTVYTELSTAPVTSVNGKTNAVTLNAIDVPFSPTLTISSDNVQDAIVEIQAAATGTAIYQDTKEPTGFINRTDSNVSFVNGTRIFTIAPTSTSFSFYIKGTKFTKTTAQNLTIPNLPGNHYIYFNTSGVLESTQVFSSDIIETYAFISIIYWNTDTNTHTYFAEERHGITMDGATHSYLHTTFGSRYLSGLALQDFTIGDGSLDSHAQFSADEGSIRDEDILLTSPVQSEIPILFRQGQLWRKKAADAFPLIYNDGIYYSGLRIPFNEYVAGSWQLTAIDSNKFVLVHFFATNDKETPIVGIQGIAQYNDIPAARNAASTEITSLSGLPFAEFVAIGTVVFQTNTYSNTPDARVRSINGANYVDFRGTQLYTPAGEATEHSLLSGLADDDHIQYHTDARGDIRYYTKSQVDTLITGITSPGDIDEKLFSISNSQALPDDVHNFIFSNSIVRAFEALVSIEVVATASLYETVKISGVQKGSDWDITLISSGDISGVAFSITTSGQIQYTSDNVAGFVSGILKFRAITTSV